MKRIYYGLPLLAALILACHKEEPSDPVGDPPPVIDTPQVSPVIFDLAHVPYDSLSEYLFYQGALKDLNPSYGVLPYEVITPLFSDYAHKKRFVWMPEGVKASYVSDSTVLDFPNGAVLIKNFYYDHVQPEDVTRILETRLLFKRNGAWEFADYVWNAEQTEATLDLVGSNVPIAWLNDDGSAHSTTYRIPSGAECQTCHKRNNLPIPIGPKPQNLNKDVTYSGGAMNQLSKWVDMGYLEAGYPAQIATVVAWDDPTQSLNDRVRAYVDMNCSHCHANDRHCDYRPMRFAWKETVDPANLGICVAPDDPLLPQHSHIVKPGNLERSLMYYRINATDETVRMPLLGRTVIHEEGRQLIADWILSLTQTCN
jgi:uncharacterized repeat protein (TIGR03806 family)